MMGAGHRAAAAAAGLTLAAATGQHAWQWPITIAAAVATSAGALSPDMDQARWWRLGDRLLPDEALGDGGPLQHRGLSHWWGVPALAALAVWVLAPPDAAWVAWAALTGWTSHLAGDLVFGRPGCGRGPGIPLLPWSGHVGVGLKVGGLLERAVTTCAVPVTLAVLTWAAAGWPVPRLTL